MLDRKTCSDANLNATTSSTTCFEIKSVHSNKRKRRPAGTPDPDAEVVSLSPKTLLESDRYVCEICKQGFQREQNLQMHRRRHKVPWKLMKKRREEEDDDSNYSNKRNKRVYVCPEESCLHHQAGHALGDMVGIKKHYRRKHSSYKQWVCEKCSKGYAVQSDFKAHLKTCGTRGHSCDCGRVFSRVESFIEHQDACTMRSTIHQPPELPALLMPMAARSSGTSASSSTSNPKLKVLQPPGGVLTIQNPIVGSVHHHLHEQNNLELQLLPSSSIYTKTLPPPPPDHRSDPIRLNLSIRVDPTEQHKVPEPAPPIQTPMPLFRDGYYERVKVSAAGAVVAAERARQEAKREIEMAEVEFENAKRMRQQAQAELERAQVLKEQATRKLSSTIMQITCHACKQKFHTAAEAAPMMTADESSLGKSYMSSPATTEGDGDHYSK